MHLAVGVPQLPNKVFPPNMILVVYGVLRSGTRIRVSTMLLVGLLLDESVVTVEAYAIVYHFAVAKVPLLITIHGIIDRKLLFGLAFALLLSFFHDSLLF